MTDTSPTTAPEETTTVAPVEEHEAKTTQQDREGLSRRRRNRKGKRQEREEKEFEESILQIDRVTRVVKGGRRMRFRVSVVIGDKKGRVGFGIGKANEVMEGVQKAVSQAKKQLIRVPIYFDTLPHEVTASFKATKVTLFPAPAGKGLIAGGAVRKILELAGVRDVLSKVHGSRNSLNMAYATLQAIQMLEDKLPPGMEDRQAAHAKAEAEKQAKASAAVEKIKQRATTSAAPEKKTDKKTEKAAVETVTLGGKHYAMNDLQLIEGIGPKVAEALTAAGVDTWKTLSQTSAEQLREILDAAEGNFSAQVPDTWPEQAALAAAGDFAALATLQESLDGGKK
ncbi:30S ribosomal protein S5 [Candidatus Peribacteria bacterium]|nr:30S ribosomal protein S5 [Candidatus Peribacteria bacterium]